MQKVNDVRRLVNSRTINHPIETEIVGTQHPIFTQYKYILANPVQVCVFCHFNNVLKRYDETCTNEYLLDLFNQNKVVDWEKVNIPSLEKNMSWFRTGNTGGRSFPIFPWDVDPKYHAKITNDYLKQI
jgi:hypothetical protein